MKIKKPMGLFIFVMFVLLFSLFRGAVHAEPQAESLRGGPPSQEQQQEQPGVGEQQAEKQKEDDGFHLIFDSLVYFPEERIKELEGIDVVEFAQYKPSRYYLEMYFGDENYLPVNEVLSNYGYAILHEVINIFWQLLLVWDFLVIVGVENGFSLDIVDGFAEHVEGVIQQFAGFSESSGIGTSGIWGKFLLIMIILTGAWITYRGLVKKETTKAWTGMLTTFFILMASLAFFHSAGWIMTELNKISSEISQEVMGVGLIVEDDSGSQSSKKYKQNSNINKSTPKYSSKETSFEVADKLYKVLILDPYKILQYGKVDVDGKRVNYLLNLPLGSQARNNFVELEAKGTSEFSNQEPNYMFSKAGVFQRFSFLIFLSLAHLFIGTVFLIIAGAMLLYQFLFVIFALFAPFAFLLALYPEWAYVAVNWLKKFIGYLILKILLGVFLSMIITLSSFLYSVTPPEEYGYAWTIIMQLILIVGVIWKRKDLISIITTSTEKITVIADPTADLKKQIKQYVDNAAKQVKKLNYPRMK
jgi:hypothetical protein